MPTPHVPTVSRAQSAIARGHVDHGEWSAPKKGDRAQNECLGPGRSYPVFKDGKLSKHALANAEARATQNDHPEIAAKARELLEKINGTKSAALSDAQPVKGLYLDDGAFGGVTPLSLSKLPDDQMEFWKEAMKPGRIKDSEGNIWNFTAADVDDAVADGQRALAMGHRPVIQNSHKNPTEGFGFITAVRKNPNGAYEQLHVFANKAKRDEALTRHTSVCLLPGYTDPHGNKWKWFPDHSAAVFRPQHKYLKHYEPALAASGEPVEAVHLSLADTGAAAPEDTNMDKIDLSVLRARLGPTAKDKPDAELPALALAAMDGLSQKLADQTEANTVLAQELGQVEKARDKALALSGGDMTDRERSQLTQAAAQARQLALSAGIAPAVAKSFDELLMDEDGEPNQLALSGAGEDGNSTFAFEIWRRLAAAAETFIKTQNRVPRGTKPVSKLSLGADDELVDPALQAEMVRMAIGKKAVPETAK